MRLTQGWEPSGILQRGLFTASGSSTRSRCRAHTAVRRPLRERRVSRRGLSSSDVAFPGSRPARPLSVGLDSARFRGAQDCWAASSQPPQRVPLLRGRSPCQRPSLTTALPGSTRPRRVEVSPAGSWLSWISDAEADSPRASFTPSLATGSGGRSGGEGPGGRRVVDQEDGSRPTIWEVVPPETRAGT